MKNLWMFGWFMIIGLLVGCAESNEVTQSESSSLPTESSEMDLVEQATVVDLVIDGDIHLFNSEKFPILFQYVSNLPKPKEALRSLPFQKIGENQYLTSFACHETYCSHLLMDFNKGTSFLLSDVSELIKVDVTQSKQYAAFLFERQRESRPTHQVTVMNLSTMEPSMLELHDEAKHLIPQPNQFLYTISDMTLADHMVKIKSIPEDPDIPMIETMWTYE